MLINKLDNTLRSIQLHLDMKYSPEQFANMSLLKDTRRIAYLLGIKTSNKRKLQLWKEIIVTVKETN